MKQFLILLSSIITSTISNNTFANFNQNTTFTNNLQTNNNNQNSLFNNQYGYLSTSDWITNQSTTNHKFYSYDSKNADYQLSSGINARNVFFVDNDGKLQYDSKLVLEKDKNDIENTKQEMISHRKVTTIKNDYNPYSKNEYSNTYFSGDNTDWQYIQFGGVEKNIDISQQSGANKVDITNLSEALGLYYIAKAAHENKISLAVAHNLGIYFISQSSLKEKINNKLVIKIIDLINDSNEIYKLIFNDKEDKNKPVFTNNDKNNSLNYIFDNNNNLVNIYYNKWNNTNNIFSTINDSDKVVAPDDGNYGYDWWWSNIKTIVNWKKYANTWNYFTKMYPTFNFGANSYLLVHNNQTGDDKKINLSDNTSAISNNKPLDLSKLENAYQNDWNSNDYYKFKIEKDYDDGYLWSQVCFALYIWHDNDNIYYQTSAVMACHDVLNEGNSFQYNLENCIFTNIMN